MFKISPVMLLYLETLKNQDFEIFFEKTWNFKQKIWKNLEILRIFKSSVV